MLDLTKRALMTGRMVLSVTPGRAFKFVEEETRSTRPPVLAACKPTEANAGQKCESN